MYRCWGTEKPATHSNRIIGAFANSVFPLTSGFISKSMILEASYYANFEIVFIFTYWISRRMHMQA